MEFSERYEELINDMWDELSDVKKYMREAMKSAPNRYFSDSIYELAKQEYGHFVVLHDQAQAIAQSWPQEHIMHHIWAHDQKRLMEYAAKVKSMIESYKK